MTTPILALSAFIFFTAHLGDPIPTTSQDTLQARYESLADLTGDGNAESVVVSVRGNAWDDMVVRLEILNSAGDLMYADEWRSRNWFGGGYGPSEDESVEDYVRGWLERTADPDYFRPEGSRAPRFGYGGREGLRYEVQWHLYEQLWREKYHPPLHEHLSMQRNRREIRAEFEGQVSEDQVEALLDEVSGGPDFVYRRHWDGIHGIAWVKSEQCFAHILFIG